MKEPRNATVVSIRATRKAPTRYYSDGLISADQSRAMDVEKLTERLSEKFLRKIWLMGDDELVLLEILAEGIAFADEEDTARQMKAAVALRFRRKQRQEAEP